MPQVRHVAVLIETSRAYGRGLLRGVAQYNREHGRWAIYFVPQGLDEPPPGWLKDWKGDGILVRIANRKTAKTVLETGLPMVELRGALSDLHVPFIGVDNCIVAQLALEHLMDRGLRNFAFCGLHRGEYVLMDERCDHFVRLAEAAGYPCDVFQARSTRGRASNWDQDQQMLAKWVGSLPKPVGIMACNDDRGLALLSACRHSGVLVPEQAAVVSVDNDDYLCTLSMPPMSSIDIGSQKIGYEAAALLDAMMEGAPRNIKPRLIPPNTVVVRQSSDVLATDDPAVVQAVSFIRMHACDRIKVADVMSHVGLTRAAIEQRLKTLLNRTVHQEIQRIQVEKVKELLGDPDLPLKQISRRCGFKYPQYMARVFRQATGQTLIEYRNHLAGRFTD